MIINLFELCSGARLTYNYYRFGGVSRDLPAEFIPQLNDFLEIFPGKINEYEELLVKNIIFMERTKGMGILPLDMAIDYGVSGPNLRASGLKWDLRREVPYSLYSEFPQSGGGPGERSLGGDGMEGSELLQFEVDEHVMSISQHDHHDKRSSLFGMLLPPYPDLMNAASPLLHDLDRSAYSIAEQGIGVHETVVDRLVTAARRHRLTAGLVDLLADRAAPPIARERAYGMLAAELAAASTRSAHSSGLAA